MNLKQYFNEKEGFGVLATADGHGVVNSAVYARPHVQEKDVVMFIMRDKKTRANLQDNTSANYLFVEHEHGYKGIRMYLTKTSEVQDKDAIEALSRRSEIVKNGEEERFLVTFTVNKVLALVGDEEIELG